MTPRLRADCPVCARPQPLRSDRTLVQHSDHHRRRRCAGSGHLASREDVLAWLDGEIARTTDVAARDRRRAGELRQAAAECEADAANGDALAARLQALREAT